MSSACINNIPNPYSSFGWLSPRLSLSVEDHPSSSPTKISSHLVDSSSAAADDFQFHLADNVTMLSADELFPLHFFTVKSAPPPPSSPPLNQLSEDPFLFSPKAPRCSGSWRDLLGLKKLSQHKTTSSSSGASSSSIKLFLNRNSKTSTSSADSSLSLPLLKESPASSSSLEYESVSLSSSRRSLSDELPRLSLGVEKPNRSLSSGPKLRTVRPRTENPRVGRSPIRNEKTAAVTTRGVSMDSPRMNPSGKVVFQSLERSSSSPSSFNGGPRCKHNRGTMERSYSANLHVRITPVLNVPVCSLRGSSKSGVFRFGQLFSSSSHTQKRENCNNHGSNSSTRSSSRNNKEKK